MPLVSVVTTVWNTGIHLEPMIRSILGQSFQDFEFLLVDDGSTDGSRDVISGFAAADSRIRPLFGQHRGAVGAANYGISQATGKYLARIDHDDLAYPNRLRDQVEFLESHPDYVLLGTDYEIISPGGAIVAHNKKHYTDDAELRQRLEFECPFCHSSTMMCMDAVRACGGYREAFDTADDYDLWLRLAQAGRIANLPYAAAQWRMHIGQSSVKKLEQQSMADTAIKLIARNLRQGGQDPFAGITNLISRSDLNRAGIGDAEIDRNILDSYELWWREFLNKGRGEEATETIGRALRFAQNSSALTRNQTARYGLLLAATHLRLKNRPQALKVFASTLKAAPVYPAYWVANAVSRFMARKGGSSK